MFRCKTCYIWNINDDKSKETALEQKKQFVRSLRGFVGPDFEFHLSGGEPLLTEGIIELIDFISSEGYKTNLVTNGFLVNDSMARSICASGLETITFSLDGRNASTHDFIRGIDGSYEKIMQAIGYIDKCRKDRKPAISILTIIMERNHKELLDLVEWVNNDERLEMISFQAITQPFCEPMNSDWFFDKKNNFLWPQDPAKAVEIMNKLRELKLKGYKIGNNPNHFIHFREYFKNPHQFLKKIKCNLGDYEFHVDPYGKAFFCCLTEPFGNINSDAIPQIWGGVSTQKIRKDVYNCKNNCHIMVNCFYEDETIVRDK
ncbi:MAG: radical SAM protein [Candidatus Omnitrophica bacterium]|nr:radical SAM protein [Candidatus Omnitrophota bacterium]MBU1928347.1 radical SAM protein [Candidatus Omnitrophota bacterium]MBU2034328.1 radical SAM protein [Candidatus Omnitrophota bacterium]MBU2221528.1 radical SAM protein [Candidatus Omnitrophota bacterium]